MWRIGSFAPSFPVWTRSTPSAIAWTSVSHFSARAIPRPRTRRAVAVQAVPTTPRTGGYPSTDTPTMSSPSRASQDRRDAQLVVLVRADRDAPGSLCDESTLHLREKCVERRPIAPIRREVATDVAVRHAQPGPRRVIEGRDTDVAAVALHDPATRNIGVVRLLPPVPLHDRIGRPRWSQGGEHVRVEGRVVERRVAEVKAVRHPLRFRRPVRFAYRSTSTKSRSPSGTETTPTTSAGHTSGHSVVRSAPSSRAARMPRITYVAGEIVESACIQLGSTSTG